MRIDSNDTENIPGTSLKGVELEKQGRIDDAITFYEKLVKNNFDGSHPYNRLAILYRKRNDYDNEKRVLEKAIELYSKGNPMYTKPKLDRFKERLRKLEERNG
jgi:tetratricopeptide (TPR) repeat protein